MKTLTLEQAKTAGRFAWHRDGWLVVDGEVVRLLLGSQDEPRPSLAIEYGQVAPETEWEYGPNMRNGDWHHLSGCDCQFCRS